jgi:hypothetical protein
MTEKPLPIADDAEEASGIAAVAVLAALCGVLLAAAVVLFALVGWRLPL